MSNLCNCVPPVYIVNALPKLRLFSSETETCHFRERWTTVGSCGFLLPRPYHSMGLCWKFSLGSLVSGTMSHFLSEGPYASPISRHLHRYKREDAVQQDHAEGHISIYTQPWFGSGRKVSLVWKTWAPAPTFWEAVPEKPENNFIVHHCFTSLSRGWCSVSKGFPESWSSKDFTDKDFTGFRSPWKWPVVLPSTVFYGWRLQWSLMGNSGTSSHCRSVRMYTSNFIGLFQRFVFNVSKHTLPYAQSEVVEAF